MSERKVCTRASVELQLESELVEREVTWPRTWLSTKHKIRRKSNLISASDKATPNKFPVSRPPPASISSEHQKFHYFRILSLFPCFLVYSGV